MRLNIFLLSALLLTSCSSTSPVYENLWAVVPGSGAAPFAQVLPQCEQYARVSENNAYTLYVQNLQQNSPPLTGLAASAQPLADQMNRQNATNAGKQAYRSTLNSCLNDSGYRLVRQCVRNCTN